MYQVIYSENALKDLKRLDRDSASRIITKIGFFAEQEDIHKFSKPLIGFGERYRFRTGDFRAIFSIDSKGKIQILMILNIKHRKEIYKHSD